MPNFQKLICLKCQKIKEITTKGKIPKNGGNPRANPLLQSMYPIIDNIFVS
jgi:hypothetical protein